MRALDDFTENIYRRKELNPHRRLVGILHQYGMRGKKLKDFLSKRRQRVVINDTKSEWKIYLFADDAKLYTEIKNDMAVKTLQKDPKNLEKWSNNSLLNINDDKCVQMTISHANFDHTARSYWLYGKQLEKVEEEKDLGFSIDSKFSFESHVFAKVKKASSVVAIFLKTFIRMTKHVFLKIYKGSHSTSS